MHPALSVIFFTVVSGAGYGMLFLLGLIAMTRPQALGGGQCLTPLLVGAVFAAAGLTSSMLHLGQPQRAWRAFGQWRSSWLSREGIAAVMSFVPVIALAAASLRGADTTVLRTLGIALAATALLTVYCTARIYTSLKTIHAWHNAYVLPGYLLLGLLAGASWLWALPGARHHHAPSVAAGIAALALAVCLLKRRYWRFLDTTSPMATPESATGLGRFGAVRSAEAPHTEENYLTHEMGFRLARKHARRLRGICLILLGPLPVVLAAMTPALPGPAAQAASAIALTLSATAGIFIERWLFFAEAKHVVMLYYRANPHARRA
jgi:DMSO reductase anchor subunit